MAIKNKEISSKLEAELRAVSFSSPKELTDDLDVHTPEVTLTTDEKVISKTTTPTPKKPFSLNQRVVTLEYLDKLEQATAASAKYESIKEFSHVISNMSIVLLSVSVIGYLIVYFINPHSVSITSLIMLSLEAFALLILTLYSMTKAATYKEIRDILVSDFSTCSQAIGNPRAESYIPMDTPEI